ncbi:MAG: 16S rRNA (guanine(966)-N(2))-methyltransferase RsmD [Methylococcales bacterium]|nr:16S rRNA (guanine(966)-N(2))-methyltransferase RsmD [Methylococcales bacterium]
MQNKLRIIAGKWRSRVIHFDDVPDLRPTPVRVRETLFNWLQEDVAGSCCLDLFSGSGALGFEAASRGAKKVTLVENNALACRTLRENSVLLEASQVQVVNGDVLRFLASNTQAPADRYNLVFLDPPFANNCTAEVCHALEDNGWLQQGAKIYIETPAQLALQNLPLHWQVLRHKTAGEVGYHLLLRNPQAT